VTAVKMCGLTRASDTAAAVAVGADYVGVIFAGGPRRLTIAQALEVLTPARGAARTVGVFGAASPEDIGRVAGDVRLDIVQLHGDARVSDVAELRRWFAGPVWAAVRAQDSTMPADVLDLFDCADAVVLDAHRAGMLGGTGVALDWPRLAPTLPPARERRAAFVLAGGLRADNVADAVRILAPDIVDVSSGIERSPGMKDHDRMRAFTDAVRAAAAAPRS
jgi:phosphoribosylanthranilate isomerase